MSDRQRMEKLKRAGLHFIQKKWDQTKSSNPSITATQDSKTELFHVEQSLAESKNIDQSVASANMPKSKKTNQLEILIDEVSQCRMCDELADTRTQTVFADGSSSAEICFVGEAPGADEDAQGIPFVGRAGQLLTKIIEACNLKREEVYICNVLKCRPPGNRNPSPNEIENCRPFLERQIQLVKPKMMVALGKFAAAHLLQEKPEKVPITKLRGQIREYCGIPFMITLHPAYLLRNPNAKKDVWEDMKTVMREIGRPID